MLLHSMAIPIISQLPIPVKLNFSSAITLETWVRMDGGGDWSRIISKHTDAGLCLRRSGSSSENLFWCGRYRSDRVPPSWRKVSWYHLAGVYNGNTVALYINGVAEAVQPAASTLSYGSNNTYNYMIGGTSWNNRCWNGAIDEARIWNVARSQAELITGMYNVVSTSSTGLVAYYKFDQGTAGGE